MRPRSFPPATPFTNPQSHPQPNMRLPTLLLTTLTALSTPAAADWLETTWTCFRGNCFYTPNMDYSHFHTDFGRYWVDAKEGCRGTGVPGMTEFCVDWGHTRGHFKFDHQDFRRCFQKNDKGEYYDCGSPDRQCWRDTWPEVRCTW